jgi:hypothetical protein
MMIENVYLFFAQIIYNKKTPLKAEENTTCSYSCSTYATYQLLKYNQNNNLS